MNKSDDSTSKRWISRQLIGLSGIAFGAAILWLVLRHTDPAAIMGAFNRVDMPLVLSAAVACAGAVAVRIWRWHRLLLIIGPAPLRRVAETLIVGYAANNALPMRLGELVRADCAKRSLGFERTSTIGTIVVERLVDGIVLVIIMALGLAGLSGAGMLQAGADTHILRSILLSAALALGGGAALIVLVARYGVTSSWMPAAIAHKLEAVRQGLAGLNRRSGPGVVSATILAWGLETIALWLLARAFDMHLAAPQVATLMGAAALSTLAPTAPGFIGTYQGVFCVTLAAFGYPNEDGVVLATAAQMVFFGPVTALGLAIYLGRTAAAWLRRS